MKDFQGDAKPDPSAQINFSFQRHLHMSKTWVLRSHKWNGTHTQNKNKPPKSQPPPTVHASYWLSALSLPYWPHSSHSGQAFQHLAFCPVNTMLSSASRGRWRHTAGWKVLFLILAAQGLVCSFPAAQEIGSREPSAQVIQNVGVWEHGGPPASAVAINQSTQSPFKLCRRDWGPVTSSAPCWHQALGTCASRGSPNTPWHLPWHPVPWQWPPVLQHLRGAGTSPHLWSLPAIFTSLTPFPLSLPAGPWTHQTCSYRRQEIIPEIATWLLFSFS